MTVTSKTYTKLKGASAPFFNYYHMSSFLGHGVYDAPRGPPRPS